MGLGAGGIAIGIIAVAIGNSLGIAGGGQIVLAVIVVGKVGSVRIGDPGQVAVSVIGKLALFCGRGSRYQIALAVIGI